MNINTSELFLYRHFDNQQIFDGFVWLINNYGNKIYSKGSIKSKLYESIHQLIEFGVSLGFEGNLWHSYLTYLLVNNENAFSISCEMTGKVSGSINQLALNDFRIFRGLYSFDLSIIEEALNANCFSLITNYKGPDEAGKNYGKSINSALSTSPDEQAFYDILTDFYKHYGVGKLGLNKAFRIVQEGSAVEIKPIAKTENLLLDDLVGYELQKNELVRNTEAFVQGYKANNVLLYGDSGTGKSSSIKAILNQYYDRGLRMIEIYKHQFGNLSAIIEQIKDRNYKFIIYMDDLSFEDYETEYKYLKAIIEGGLEASPDNILLYATSNRRHLIREKWSDKDGRNDDLHTNDTVQEKLSLASRFGLSILYISPGRKEFEHIVKVLANRHGINMPEEELYLEANRWELRHGGLSGRTAQHFITYLLGKDKI